MPAHLRSLLVTLPGLLIGLALLGGCRHNPDGSTEAAAPPQSSGSLALPDSVLSPPDTTADRFEAALQTALSHSEATDSIGPVVQAVGRHFRGRPYRTGTLDAPTTETLVARFDGFDCVTFVETALALARGAQASDTTYAGFARRLAGQRYRGGGPVGYCGRLHYFTEWIADNATRGHVRRLGAQLEGRPLRDTLDFMSTHRSAYDRFATDDSLFACVRSSGAIRCGTCRRTRSVPSTISSGPGTSWRSFLRSTGSTWPTPDSFTSPPTADRTRSASCTPPSPTA